MFLHKIGKFYQLFYKQPSGKLTKKSTKCTSLKEAEQYKLNFQLSQMGIKIPLTQAIQKNSIEFIEQPNRHSLSDFTEKISEFNKTNIGSTTHEIYLRVLNDLHTFFGDLFLDEITTDKLEKYKNWRLQTVKPATVNIEIITLRRMFTLAIKWKLLTENPATELQKLRIEQKEILTFTESQFNSLLEIIEKDEDSLFYRLAIFGYYTGARLSEILHLQWSNINMEEKTIKIVNKENFKTKTRKNRVIPISQKLFAHLLEIQQTSSHCNQHHYLFPNPWGFPLTKHYVSRRFVVYCNKALLRKYHFHCLRHTFITSLLKKGVPIIKVMKLVGHSQISTTMRYLHLFVDDIRNEVDLL